MTKQKLNIINSDVLLTKKFEPSEFVIHSLIPKSGITIISGNPGSCKSWILLEIAKAIGSGHRLFKIEKEKIESPQDVEEKMRFSTEQSSILYLDEETTFPELQRRWSKIKPPKFTQVDFMSMEGWKIDREDHKKMLLEIVKKRNYKVVIFDSLIDFHSRSENDATDAQFIIDCLREFTRIGVTVLLAHHQRKEIMGLWKDKDPSQMLRGSSAILGGLDSLIAIEKMEESSKKIVLTITQAKLRQGRKLDPFRIDLIDEDDVIKFEHKGELMTEISKREELKELIIKFIEEEANGNTYQAEVVGYFKMKAFGEKTIIRSWKEMKEEEVIVPTETIGKITYYQLK